MSLKQEILALNAERSDVFNTPIALDARALYSYKYPTKMLVFKCMDGRINLPLITGVPLGKLHPFRNIGGKFVLGDPYLGRLILDSKDQAVRAGRPTFALCTYHFSKGSEHRGCAGHQYDTEAARRGAFTLKNEFGEVFGEQNPTIAAIVVGVETDEDSLVFCGTNGEDFSIADNIDITDGKLQEKLFALYPDVEEQMLRDLLPLAVGNRDHVARIKREGRPIQELVHNENIIGVGRGFDWLHLPNRALIIGPYGHTDSTWRDAVLVAGNIVRDNFAKNPELKAGGALLLVSAAYTRRYEHGIAKAKAKYFAQVASQVLDPFKDELSLEMLVGVTDTETMRYHPLDI